MKTNYGGCTQDSKQSDTKELKSLQSGMRRETKPAKPDYKKLAKAITTTSKRS